MGRAEVGPVVDAGERAAGIVDEAGSDADARLGKDQRERTGQRREKLARRRHVHAVERRADVLEEREPRLPGAVAGRLVEVDAAEERQPAEVVGRDAVGEIGREVADQVEPDGGIKRHIGEDVGEAVVVGHARAVGVGVVAGRDVEGRRRGGVERAGERDPAEVFHADDVDRQLCGERRSGEGLAHAGRRVETVGKHGRVEPVARVGIGRIRQGERRPLLSRTVSAERDGRQAADRGGDDEAGRGRRRALDAGGERDLRLVEIDQRRGRRQVEPEPGGERAVEGQEQPPCAIEG